MRLTSFLLCVILLVSCVQKDFLWKEKEYPYYPGGAHIKVSTGRGDIQGELIAAHNDTVFIAKQGSLVSIPRNTIQTHNLQLYNPQSPVWIFPVAVAYSVSHGILGLFTIFPNLIFAGGIMSIYHSPSNIRSENITFEELHKYARFPMGIPSGVDRNQLSPIKAQFLR